MSEVKRPEKYEVPSWDLIYDLCIDAAGQVIRSGYKPEIIIAISRGGWIPGRILSDILGNDKLATIKVEYYSGIYHTRDKPEITQPLSLDVKGKRVLLVDDIADSGNSLRMVKEHLVKSGASEIRVCTLYQKPWSVLKPDFNVRNTDAWVCFPHEIFETMEKLYNKFKGEGMSEEEIKKRLRKIGIKPKLISSFIYYRRFHKL